MTMKKQQFSSRPPGGRTNKRPIAVYLLLALALFLGAVLETSAFLFLSVTPGITLALISAAGFLMDERVGAIGGLAAGFVTAALGGEELSFAPLLFLLCGYFCGRAVGVMFAKSYPAFLVCGALAGLLKEGFTLLQYGLFSKDFSFFEALKTVLLPDYLAFLICIAAVYPLVFGIERIRKK